MKDLCLRGQVIALPGGFHGWDKEIAGFRVRINGDYMGQPTPTAYDYLANNGKNET